MTVRTIDDIFRDFNIDGVPASGTFNPHKPDIRDTLKALTEGGSSFPDNRVIRLNNANSGSANNIVVSTSVTIPATAYQVLYILNVTQENTGPVDVSGAISRQLVTNRSEPIPAGYLVPGMAVLCIDTGTELRMLSYGDVESVVEEFASRAEAAEAAAELAKDQAQNAASDAVSQGNVPIYSTRNAVETLEIPAGISAIRTNGFGSVGDGGGALYKRVSSEPSHAGKVQSADGAWWELSRDIIQGTIIGGQFDDEPYLGIIGGVHFGHTTTNSDPRGYSNGFFRRTGDTSLEYGNNIRAVTMVQSAIDHVENTSYFSIIQDSPNSAVEADLVATVSTAVKSPSAIGSNTSLWGANPLVIDQTNRKSSVSGPDAFLRGLETNVSAGGPDDANRRIGHDVIMFHPLGYPDSVDGLTSHYCGQRVTTSAGINSSLVDVAIKYAYISDPSPNPSSSKGIIEVGYLSQDSRDAGFLVKGQAPSGGAFRAEITGGGAEINLISDLNLEGAVISGETTVGRNSIGTEVIYGQMRQQIGSGVAGSEQGYWHLSQMLNGVKTDVLAAIGSGPNPIFIYVNGALKQVTVGAADSGGAGYRMLRIAN